jgi:hypothetical protein
MNFSLSYKSMIHFPNNLLVSTILKMIASLHSNAVLLSLDNTLSQDPSVEDHPVPFYSAKGNVKVGSLNAYLHSLMILSLMLKPMVIFNMTTILLRFIFP